MHSPTWPVVVRLPGFWIGCSVIFLVNAFLSACFGQWPLAAVQLGTAVMATAAAAAARANDKASARTAAAAG